MSPLLSSLLASRQYSQMPENNSIASEIASQWRNPSDVTTILMVIGGDVIQKALAQTTGCWYTPVCFSFGWVAYSFMSMINILGDGRLLPEPDIPCKVINLSSGYSRDNKNWVIGRLVRDNEAYMSRGGPLSGEAIRISVWEALDNPNQPTKHQYWSIHQWGLICMILQLLLAAVPLALYGDWGVLLITGGGTILSVITGALPQWTAEKLPNRQRSKYNYALTVGNGSRDIMVIIGAKKCLDLEELSASETPRNGRPWQKFTTSRNQNISTWPIPSLIRRTSSELTANKLRGGLPTGFWITYIICVIQALLWLVLLITVSALQSHTWFLLGVGLIGMFQNGFLAAVEIRPEHRNMPLQHRETIVGTRKVMDGLMDLEAVFGCGKHLVPEFFPGPLEKEEKDWWGQQRAAYDAQRAKERDTRGPPRTPDYMPSFRSESVALAQREGELQTTSAHRPSTTEHTSSVHSLKDLDPADHRHPAKAQNPSLSYPQLNISPDMVVNLPSLERPRQGHDGGQAVGSPRIHQGSLTRHLVDIAASGNSSWSTPGARRASGVSTRHDPPSPPKPARLQEIAAGDDITARRWSTTGTLDSEIMRGDVDTDFPGLLENIPKAPDWT